MKKIIVQKDFSFNGKNLIAGDELKLDDINAITKLNELGFIEPLNTRDLILLERELKSKNKNKEENE